MNITEIKQLTTTDGWVDFAGSITKVGEIKGRVKSDLSKTPGQQYNVQKLQIQDSTDVIGVWAYADRQFLPNQSVTVRGMLKEFNQVRYIDFASVKLLSQQAPQQQSASQAQNVAPATSQAPSRSQKEVDWDAIAEGKVRCAILCAMLQGDIPEGAEICYDEVLRHTFFVMNGREMNREEQLAQELAEPENNNPVPTGDDIPF